MFTRRPNRRRRRPGLRSVRPGGGLHGLASAARSAARPSGTRLVDVSRRSDEARWTVRPDGPDVEADDPANGGADDGPDGPEDGPVSGVRVVRDGGPRRPSGAGSVLPPRPERGPAGLDDDGPERGERRALVAPWLSDPWPMIRWWFGDRAHAVAFHLLHLHVYGGRAVAWSPRGYGRGLVGAWRWVTDVESAGLRWQAAELGDVDGYLYLSQQSSHRQRARAVIALTVAGVVAAGVLVGWSTLVGRLAVLVAGVAVGGWLGRPADRPLFDHPVSAPSTVRITPDLLVEAFCTAKLCNKHDDPERHQTVTFLAPVTRDGKGWRAVVDMPGGHTASKALARREQIAAGLGIDEVRVFLERVRGDEGSARRVSCWVADRDPYAARPVVSPLAAVPRWEFWDGVPYGVDARGRPVVVPLVFSSMLTGAIPRMGKTYAARQAAAAAALDPNVRLIVFDAKGPDWQPFEAVAHRCGFGPRDVVVEHLVEVLDECCTDMDRRYETLGSLPVEVRPESKVTPGITANRRLDMPLTLICIDEVQEYLGHHLHGDRILELLVRLVKVGPAVGYMVSLATQRPDGNVIATDLRDNIGTRFALRVMTWQSSDIVLGAGAFKAGLDASTFLNSHKGVGILMGADAGELAEDGPQVVRTYLLDMTAIGAIVERGRALRLAAGTLTGAAAGEQLLDDRPRRSVLDDIAAVFAAGEQKLWSETICARLAHDHPETYGGWGPPELAAALTPHNVATAQQWGVDDTGKGRNRRGVVRSDITTALAARTDSSRPTGVTSTGRRLAPPDRLAPDTARSSTAASTPVQATSDLAHPVDEPDTPGNGDSPAGPLGDSRPELDPTDDDGDDRP